MIKIGTVSAPLSLYFIRHGETECRDVLVILHDDIDQRRDWLALFPFLATRRPDAYSALVQGPDPGPTAGR